MPFQADTPTSPEKVSDNARTAATLLSSAGLAVKGTLRPVDETGVIDHSEDHAGQSSLEVGSRN